MYLQILSSNWAPFCSGMFSRLSKEISFKDGTFSSSEALSHWFGFSWSLEAQAAATRHTSRQNLRLMLKDVLCPNDDRRLILSAWRREHFIAKLGNVTRPLLLSFHIFLLIFARKNCLSLQANRSCNCNGNTWCTLISVSPLKPIFRFLNSRQSPVAICDDCVSRISCRILLQCNAF